MADSTNHNYNDTVWIGDQSVRGYAVSDTAARMFALDRALQACIAESKPDGQTVIRRAVGFHKFLTNNLGGVS